MSVCVLQGDIEVESELVFKLAAHALQVRTTESQSVCFSGTVISADSSALAHHSLFIFIGS